MHNINLHAQLKRYGYESHYDIYIYIYIYPDTAKHQNKPQVYISDIVRYSTLWSDIKPAVEQTTRKQRLFSPKCQQKGRRSIRHQQRFYLS